VLVLLLTLAAPAAPPLVSRPPVSASDQARLDAGEIVMLPSAADRGGARALVEIAASPTRVWQIVADPVHLQASSRSVRSLQVYRDQTDTAGIREQGLAYVVKVAFSDVHYNVLRRYDLAAGRMTWVLDNDRANDIAATTGTFSTWPTDDGGTLFSYDARVDTGHAMPAWIQDELTEAGLKRFLGYLQRVAPQ